MKLDPNIERKSAIINRHFDVQQHISGVPAFSVIEFNPTELCNRTCEFCPRVDPEVYPNRNLFLRPELMEKIARELGEFNYSGKALFSAFGEPLLHKELETLIRLLKERCPDVRIESVTNGDYLTVERARSLFDSGLSTLLVSMYDGPHQKEEFESIRHRAGLREDQLITRIRYLSREEGFGLTMSNRAGNIQIEELGVAEVAEPLKQECFYPHYQFTVDWDGSVLLCPHDWGKKIRAGNLNDQSILEIWNGKALTFARKRLGCGDRRFDPCNVCDVSGTLMGRNHFEAWESYFSGEGGK